jgi:hypothetical protein
MVATFRFSVSLCLLNAHGCPPTPMCSRHRLFVRDVSRQEIVLVQLGCRETSQVFRDQSKVSRQVNCSGTSPVAPRQLTHCQRTHDSRQVARPAIRPTTSEARELSSNVAITSTNVGTNSMRGRRLVLSSWIGNRHRSMVQGHTRNSSHLSEFQAGHI